MTSGVQWKPYHNANLPRVNHSVFGDFPKEYMKNLKKKASVTKIDPIDR